MIDKTFIKVFIFGAPGQGFSSYPSNYSNLVSGFDQSGKRFGESISEYVVKPNKSIIIHVLYGLTGIGQDGNLRGGRNFGVWIEIAGHKVKEEHFASIHEFLMNFLEKGAYNPNLGLFDQGHGKIEKYQVFSFDELKSPLDKLLELLVVDFIKKFSNQLVPTEGNENDVYELDPEKIDNKKRERERQEKERREREERKAKEQQDRDKKRQEERLIGEQSWTNKKTDKKKEDIEILDESSSNYQNALIALLINNASWLLLILVIASLILSLYNHFGTKRFEREVLIHLANLESKIIASNNERNSKPIQKNPEEKPVINSPERETVVTIPEDDEYCIVKLSSDGKWYKFFLKAKPFIIYAKERKTPIKNETEAFNEIAKYIKSKSHHFSDISIQNISEFIAKNNPNTRQGITNVIQQHKNQTQDEFITIDRLPISGDNLILFQISK